MRPFADTDGEGLFALKTYVGGDGAPPGDYRVSVVAPAGDNQRAAGHKDDRHDDSVSAASNLSIPLSLRKKYADVDTAGIEVTIHEGENDLEPFVLQ